MPEIDQAALDDSQEEQSDVATDATDATDAADATDATAANAVSNTESATSVSSITTRPLPRVILKRRRAMPFYYGHPWVFAGAIQNVEGRAEPGDEAMLYSHEGDWIARGLYNPKSNIRLRLYNQAQDESMGREFWSQRLDRAIALRTRLYGEPDENNAMRLVFSEADGLSGLIVDWYGGWAVVQISSLALAMRKLVFAELLQEKLKPKGMWLRVDREIEEVEGLDLEEGLLLGDASPPTVFFNEGGVKFAADLVKGQKTGFYLDQRANRQAVASYSDGRRVLDLFCYTGGFSMTVLKQGNAKAVVGVDSSAPAIAAANAHAQLNGVATKCRFIKSSVFAAMKSLKEEGEQFDVAIVDPPKLVKSRRGIRKAMRTYHSLNEQAVELLTDDGVLVTCSCSGLVERGMFEEMLAGVGAASKRTIQILEARGQAPDHPVATQCSETSYLKCYICRVTR